MPLQRDYILAIIEQFFQALRRVVESIRNTQQPTETDLQQFEDLYNIFLNDNRQYFLTAKITDIYATFGNSDKTMAQKEMLAELLYSELELFDHHNHKREICEKLLALYDDIDNESDSFSFRRAQRRQAVNEMLELLE